MSTSTAVTWLFVPGSRPDRFDKAAAAGADEIILDLEDAVAPDGKDEARAAVSRWLATGSGWVRVNAPGTEWHQPDLEALRGLPGLRGVMVPMAEDPATLEHIGEQVGATGDQVGTTGEQGPDVVALVETALGVHRAVDLARSPAVSRLAFGSIDLALDLDCDESDEALRAARSQLVLASRVAGIAAPIDGVTVETGQADVIAAAARRSRGLGFAGKLGIHPAQLEPIASAFTPSAEDLAWARKVLDVAADGAVALDGQMIDKPVIERAQRLVARAGERNA